MDTLQHQMCKHTVLKSSRSKGKTAGDRIQANKKYWLFWHKGYVNNPIMKQPSHTVHHLPHLDF